MLTWIGRVLLNLLPNTVHIAYRHLEFAYQFVLSFRYSPAVNLRQFPFSFPFIPSASHLFLFLTHPGGSYSKLSRGATFTVFTYIHSLLIEKDICDCRNVSVKLPCVYLCLSSGDLFIFSASFVFLFIFLINIFEVVVVVVPLLPVEPQETKTALPLDYLGISCFTSLRVLLISTKCFFFLMAGFHNNILTLATYKNTKIKY